MLPHCAIFYVDFWADLGLTQFCPLRGQACVNDYRWALTVDASDEDPGVYRARNS